MTGVHTDRRAGALLGTAVGDALGVPYEFSTPPGPAEVPAMRGGGLGDFAPGEWSDDTSMAVAVARVAATGADLRADDALDAVAAGFLEWYDGGPADIGIQTRAVLARARARWSATGHPPGRLCREEARVYALDHPHSAGNGALMRTAAVAWSHPDDRLACADAARSVAALTHADPLAGDSCVLWSEAVRVALATGDLAPEAGVDLLPPSRRQQWRGWLAEALAPDDAEVPGARFRPNGFTVTAVQAAVAAIAGTASRRPEDHLVEAIHAATRIGDDTDTVAAITGALVGAAYGAEAIPAAWRAAVHGWPGLTGDDLVALASRGPAGPTPDAD